MPHQQVLSILLHAPQPTDIPVLPVRRSLAEQGIELTPQEAEDAVELVVSKVRRFLLGAGCKLPDSDIEMLALLREKFL